MSKEITRCPNCGSHDVIFVTQTDACFEINQDGSIGNVILDSYGVDCINESVNDSEDNVEFHCRHCGSSFHVRGRDDNAYGFEIADEI